MSDALRQFTTLWRLNDGQKLIAAVGVLAFIFVFAGLWIGSPV